MVFVPGALERTGNPLDLAATGDAFFVVNGPNGPLLTRNGALQLNQAGELQTTSGLNLRGEGGAITIPPDTRQIVINEEGTVFADGAQIGHIISEGPISGAFGSSSSAIRSAAAAVADYTKANFTCPACGQIGAENPSPSNVRGLTTAQSKS